MPIFPFRTLITLALLEWKFQLETTPAALRPSCTLRLDQRDLGGKLQFNHHREPPIYLKEQCGFLVRDHLLKFRNVFQPELSVVAVKRDPALDVAISLRI